MRSNKKIQKKVSAISQLLTFHNGSLIIYYTYHSHAYASERASICASNASSSSLTSAMDWVFIN